MTLRCVERLGDFARTSRAARPPPARALAQRSRVISSGVEFALQRGQHAPIEIGQLRLGRVLHLGQLVRFRCPAPSPCGGRGRRRGRRCGCAGMTRKCSAPVWRAEQRAVLLDRITLRHFHRRPEPVIRAGRRRVGRADDDVAGERIVAGTCKSNAASSFSSGNCHATSAPSARFVAISVCRTRRIVPARSIARMRSITVSTSTPDCARSRRSDRARIPECDLRRRRGSAR